MKVTTQTDIPSHFQGICHHANIFNSIQSLLPGRRAECEHIAAIVCVCTSEHVCTIRRTTTTTQNTLHLYKISQQTLLIRKYVNVMIDYYVGNACYWNNKAENLTITRQMLILKTWFTFTSLFNDALTAT